MIDNYIASIIEPTISLDEQSLTDFSYGSAGFRKSTYKSFESRSVDYPYLSINKYTFSREEILKCEIDCTNHIPRIYLKLILTASGEFLSRSFPKDGDLVSFYIRGRDDLFKPIRNDYLITSVTSNSSNSSVEGRGMIINIEGELNIPGLYDENIYSIDGTSFDTMKFIAQRLGLGFATNETDTDDKMIWINPNVTSLEFMKDIVSAAWKDEYSFFTFFIDVYYNLNFINVNKLISYNADVLLALGENTISSGFYGDDKVSKGLAEKCFVNHPNQNQTNFFIKHYKPINNSSKIAKNHGYATNSIFYDHNEKRYWQLQAKSIITEGSGNERIILRGRAGDDSYNNQQKFRYDGIQYNNPSGNLHNHFYYARAHNLMNNIEMDKLNVEIELNKFNLNIYRYENIPVVLFITNDIKRIQQSNLNADPGIPFQNNEDAVPIALDRFYTGYYLIKGMKIKYCPSGDENITDSGINETLILTRREWPAPII